MKTEEPPGYDPFQASASSVSTFELCPRKWAFPVLDGVERVQHPSAAFGERVHGHLEDWLRSGVVPMDSKEEKVAQIIIPHLPPPQSVDPNNVELPLSMRLGGLYFVGRIDLYMPEHSETKRPRVYDHKTTGDFGWALVSELMADDVQATLYAAWAMLRSKSGAVDVQWTYGLTKGAPKARPVVATLSGKDIKERVSKTIETARTMKEITQMKGLRALDVPYNAESCEAYGGCPFREKCNLSAQERIESIMSQGNAQGTLLEQLRAKRNANKKETPEAGTSTQPVNPPSGGNGNGAGGMAGLSPLEKLKQKKAAAAVVTPPPEPEPEVTPEPETTVLEQAQPAARRAGPGRPRKQAAVVEESTPAEIPELEPKHLWIFFAAAALIGGKSSEQAQADAGDLVLAHAELFPKEG